MMKTMKKEAKMMTFFYAWTWGGLRNARTDRKYKFIRGVLDML